MHDVLQIFILLPMFGLLLAVLVPPKKERILSGLSMAVFGLHVLGVSGFIAFWWMNQSPVLDEKHFTIYESPEFEFFINYYFDKTTAVFAFVGVVLTFLVAFFSRFYLHREAGFKRFFVTLLLFSTGYNLVVFSGNMETLFIGWEILGISSFLLIAFYRDRYLPVKNALKVLSFYRLGDICLILAMWMSHHLWHKNITFAAWDHWEIVAEKYQTEYLETMFIAGMIVLAAAIKSAQLPFSTWLPRAMEGPTTSSAIFYGSLTVHIGAFLLLRTAPFWAHEDLTKGVIVAIGLCTSLVATGIARVQSSVKTQIAYSSIAQIGLIFIEIGLGWHILALVHFAGNAFLRTYQLLVSPSVLSYRVHDMFFQFTPRTEVSGSPFWQRIRQAYYVLNIKEWNLDFLLTRYLWQPFKWLGRQMGFVSTQVGIGVWMLVLLAGIVSVFMKENIHPQVYENLPLLFAAAALLLILNAFTERGDARSALLLVIFSQFFKAIAILLNKEIEWHQVLYYLGGSVLCAMVGFVCLNKIKKLEGNIDLDQYHGHSYEHPRIALVFLLCGLGLAGFPITTTFIGVDLMFTHISAHELELVLLMAINFLFLELTILRMYARIFMGQHRKMYHPVAFRSS